MRGAVQTTFKDPITPKTTKRRTTTGSEEGQWRKEKRSSEAGDKDREREDNDRRRIRSVSTWRPTRKRSASPRCGPGRCKSPHLCRSAALKGCRHGLSNPSPDSRRWLRTPEDRGRSPTIQERLGRWPGVNNLEQTRLVRAWGLLEKERKMVTEAMDALLVEAGRGVNAMSTMTQRVEDVMTGLRFSYCAGWREGGGRERFEPRTVRAHSAGNKRGLPAARGTPKVGEKEKPVVIEVRSRDGSRTMEPVGLEAFAD